MAVRVALVAPEGLPIPPVRGGSVQIYLEALARELDRLGIDATLLSPGAGEAACRNHIRLAGMEKVTYRSACLAELRRMQPDVVQVDNRPDFVPWVRRAVPSARVLLNLHSTTFLGPRHIDRARARRVLRDADRVVLNSDFLRREIARTFRLDGGDWRPVVIHPGVDLARFALPEGRERGAWPPFRLLYVGRVIRGKGVHVLVEAVRQLRQTHIPVRLTLVGRTPPWEAAYERRLRIQMRGLPVRWTGFVPPAELPPRLWRAHALVCPSQAPEAFGLVNVEAMAAGVPVIASRQGGIPEIVDASCGILVRQYRDPAAFARAIRTLMADRARWEALSDGARRRAQTFSWRRSAEAFTQVYRELCPGDQR
ncbi:glycosyltransferase family 4 protein [Alicyclobacillus sp.]|uniref:glycosyltransferase family 4 protein n=1 Tax=Alicyclobacillus sp. TaxID=61169 RepID=UPI0025C08300|nr:glycosyltransferase family 4 protein [Alicyclobacillus sp.]MCL6515731.1 glycosyltransferase family 4 protein [Alicyclobacillus sp.]